MSADRPYLPYGRQTLDAEDVESVTRVLTSDWLTTGPNVEAFERELAAAVGSQHAVAVSNGTAALHCAMHALDLGPGDELVVPTLTFAASANCALFQGATPVLCDVDPDSLLIDPVDAARRITGRTRAIVAVDYAGQPCDYDALVQLASERDLTLISDSAHALGASYAAQPLSRFASLVTFSFHPVKHITTGEGGAIATDDEGLARRMRRFRNHGIDSDFRQREQRGSFEYDVLDLGYNYRLSDIACALGRSQLRKLPVFLARRREIAARYDEAFAGDTRIRPLERRVGREHAYHLYVVRLADGETRLRAFETLRRAGIGVNVHYRPLHLHTLYRERLGTRAGDCPNAEAVYPRLLSLPMWPAMNDADVARVIEALQGAV